LKWAAAGGSGLTFAKVIKTADEQVVSSTTLQDDDALKFTPSVSKTYHIYALLFINSGSTPDFKYDLSIPSGADSLRVNGSGTPASAIGTIQWHANPKNITTAGNNQYVWTQGRVVMGTTAGDIIIQWAQQTSDTGLTKVLLGSFLLAWEE